LSSQKDGPVSQDLHNVHPPDSTSNLPPYFHAHPSVNNEQNGSRDPSALLEPKKLPKIPEFTMPDLPAFSRPSLPLSGLRASQVDNSHLSCVIPRGVAAPVRIDSPPKVDVSSPTKDGKGTHGPSSPHSKKIGKKLISTGRLLGLQFSGCSLLRQWQRRKKAQRSPEQAKTALVSVVLQVSDFLINNPSFQIENNNKSANGLMQTAPSSLNTNEVPARLSLHSDRSVPFKRVFTTAPFRRQRLEFEEVDLAGPAPTRLSRVNHSDGSID